MANELITTDPADRSRLVAEIVSASKWNLGQAMAVADGVDLVALEARYREPARPLSETEPDGMSAREPGKRGRYSRALGDALGMICTKSNPTMSADQSDAWVKAMLLALDNVPGKVAVAAAAAVLRRSVKFLGDVDGMIRDEAATVLARRTMVAARIRELREAMEWRAPAQVKDRTSIDATPNQLRRWPREWIDMGIGQGWLDPAAVAAAREGLADDERSAYVPEEKAF